MTVSNAPRTTPCRGTRRDGDPVGDDARRRATPKPLFTVTTGIGHFVWLCHTAAGTIIEPELAMPYLSQAEIERMVYDPPNRKLEASLPHDVHRGAAQDHRTT